jgi:hypothetical protein
MCVERTVDLIMSSAHQFPINNAHQTYKIVAVFQVLLHSIDTNLQNPSNNMSLIKWFLRGSRGLGVTDHVKQALGLKQKQASGCGLLGHNTAQKPDASIFRVEDGAPRLCIVKTHNNLNCWHETTCLNTCLSTNLSQSTFQSITGGLLLSCACRTAVAKDVSLLLITQYSISVSRWLWVWHTNV